MTFVMSDFNIFIQNLLSLLWIYNTDNILQELPQIILDETKVDKSSAFIVETAIAVLEGAPFTMPNTIIIKKK